MSRLRTWVQQLTAYLAENVLACLTAIWLTSFATSVLIVNSYVRIVDSVYIVPPEDRWVCLQPVVLLYSSYVAGILAFWFLKPFKKPKADEATRIRAVIGVLCTVAFNVVVVYFLSQNYLSSSDADVIENVRLAVKVGGALSFLVAPINFYYFGMKMK